MKHKLLTLVLAVVVIVSLVLAGCAKPASTTETIRLVYGSHDPPVGWEVKNCSEPWVEEVAKATNGVVQIEGHYGQSLFKGTDALEAVKGGQADLAWLAMGFFPGVASLGEVISLPFLPIPDSKTGGLALWDLYDKYPSIQKQFTDQNIKILNFCVLGPFFTVTSNKQVKTLDDFNGLKLRVHGGPPTDMLKALGGVPVPVGINEVYPNMEKGVIDGAMLPWEAMISFKVYEVTKYYTYAPFYHLWFAVAMNLDKWNSLPPDIQEAIMGTLGGPRERSGWWSYNMSDTSAVAGRKIVQEEGTPMIEYTMPAEEVDKCREVAARPIWDKWVADNEAKGFSEAKDILNTALELLK